MKLQEDTVLQELNKKNDLKKSTLLRALTHTPLKNLAIYPRKIIETKTERCNLISEKERNIAKCQTCYKFRTP